MEKPERDERSNASEEANRSKNLGVGGVALDIPLIAWTNKVIAATISTLPVMLLRINNLTRVLVLRPLMVTCNMQQYLREKECYYTRWDHLPVRIENNKVYEEVHCFVCT